MRDTGNIVSQESDANNIGSHPLSDPAIVEAMKMKEQIIDHLGHNYDSLLAGNKPYLETRKKVLDDYAAGKKDSVTLRSFTYLSSLE